MKDYFPKRIVCLTEEFTEILYILGQQDRIVGISQFTERPLIAKKEKPKVSAFTSADTKKIIELKPDLVIGFSDIQAEIASSLIKLGLNVLIFNQRSINEIYEVIQAIGAIVGCTEKANQWILNNIKELDEIKLKSVDRKIKPKVYFEEWYDPIISNIQWVGELVKIAGGDECFPALSKESLAKYRIIENPDEVVKQNPDIIMVSWCGAKFIKDKLTSRPGWDKINALKNDQIYEINSTDILQPGPAALTDGLKKISEIIDKWALEHNED
ncbi:MAG: cobalamin-binding protein [Planctomycetota bacterium]|nr:MAG: cobalamin-binding protein [Planctomycetota bacterium]